MKIIIANKIYTLRHFFNIDPDAEGIEVYQDGEVIITLYGWLMPDPDDPQDMAEFKENLAADLDLIND